MTDGQADVYGGVDTHRDVHMAAVVDTTGRVLGSAPFGADPVGYEQMNNWLQSQGRVLPGRSGGHWQLRRRPGPFPNQSRCRGGRGEPSQPLILIGAPWAGAGSDPVST